MEFLQLRYFYESALSQSLSGTARKYMVPASSVSASIKRLEEELGCCLFERLSNRILLNENGKRLQQSLAVIFKELEQAVSSISHTVDDAREVRILVRALRATLTDCVIRYKTEHVNAKFRLISSFEQEGLDDYDIIVDTQKEGYTGYDFFEFCRQRVYIYAAKDSPLCTMPLSLAQLADQAFVTMSPLGNQYKLLMDACQKAGFSPRLLAQINDSACFFKFIASGAAVGVAGERSVRADMAIVPLRITDFKEQQTVCVYYKRESAYGHVKKFIEFLKKES